VRYSHNCYNVGYGPPNSQGHKSSRIIGLRKGVGQEYLVHKRKHVMEFNNITRKEAEHIDQIVRTGLIPKCATRFMRRKVVHKPWSMAACILEQLVCSCLNYTKRVSFWRADTHKAEKWECLRISLPLAKKFHVRFVT